MDYVSADEIMGLARQIKDLAVKRRADELSWAPKGAIPDERFTQPNGVNPNIVKGGTTSDYATLESGYEWIVSAFQYAIGPEPSGLDGAIAGMDAVRTKLRGKDADPMVFNTEPDKDGKVRLIEADASRDKRGGELKDLMLTHLDGWEGEGARTFKEKFAIPLPGVIANQVLMVSALRSAISTNRTVYVYARNDLKGIAKATIDALNFKTGSDGPSVTMTLSVVAGVLGVTAACVTGPGAIIFFTAASTIAGVTKDAIDEANSADQPAPKGKEYHVGGYTVDDILMSCYDLIQEAQKYVTQSEDTIIQGLQQNQTTLSGSTRADFVSPRPKFVDRSTDLGNVKDGHDFYPD